MKKISFITTTEGCATNLLENATYRKTVTSGDYESTKDLKEADIIVVNTCAYTLGQEERSLKVITDLQNEYPDKEIIVGGCLTKINPVSLGKVHTGFTFEPAQYDELNRHLNVSVEKVEEAYSFDEVDFVDLSWVHGLVNKVRPFIVSAQKKTRLSFPYLNNILETSIVNTEYFGVTVSKGCAGKCTFCAIKNAKGYVKSREIDDVMAQINWALNSGHKKIWLLGDDIGCYGIDIGVTFVDLLKKILEIEKEFSLIINYFEPFFFLKYYEEMKGLLSDKRVVNFNLPIQSGNYEVVRKMGREYDPKLVLKKLKDLKKANPCIVVKTNIITSFPTEGIKQFIDSIFSVFFFDAILAIDFTARPGTGAEKYKQRKSKLTKIMRHKIINIAILLRHFVVFAKSLTFFKVI